MTKIKNSTVLSLFESINMLEGVGAKMPIKVFYANTKNRNALSTPYEEVNKSRFKLLETHGVKDEKSALGFKLEADNRTFAFKSKAAKKKFEEELQPIMNEEIDVKIHQVSIEDFSGVEVDRATFPLVDLYLEWIIKE